MSAWLAAFFLLPLAGLVLYSFWRVQAFQIVREVSFENYRRVFATPVNRRALVDSLIIGITTGAVTVGLALPLAWAIRFHAHKHRNRLVGLILVASMGSYLARIYSWRSILGSEGLINWILVRTGILGSPIEALIFNRFSVIIALVHLFLPFAFLPIYASLLSVSPSVLEAGRVLGAGPTRTFIRIGFPMASPGLVISFIYVLIFATGDFAAPAFLGGAEGLVAAQVIVVQFSGVYNWPLGAAMAVVYMVLLALISAVLGTYAIRRTRQMQA